MHCGGLGFGGAEVRFELVFLLLLSAPVQVDHAQEEDEVGDCLVELCRMAGQHIHPFKDESPGTSAGLPIISEFIRLARRMQQAVTGVATAIMSSTSI